MPKCSPSFDDERCGGVADGRIAEGSALTRLSVVHKFDRRLDAVHCLTEVIHHLWATDEKKINEKFPVDQFAWLISIFPKNKGK